MIAFPANPTPGQIHPPLSSPEIDGRRWRWNGSAWSVLTIEKSTQEDAESGTDNTKWMTPLRTAQAIAAQASKVHISATPPSPAVNGTLWIDSATYRIHALREGVWAEISAT